MSRLNVLPNDIKTLLNPTGEDDLFLGPNCDVSVSDVEESISEHEETVYGRLPGRVITLMTKVDGEWLIRAAMGGETTFHLGLTPTTNLKLYLNLQGKTWPDRTPFDVLPASDYDYTSLTGLVELHTPLSAGASLIAEYNHGAAATFRVLRRIVRILTACYWATWLYSDPETVDRFKSIETQAYSDLGRLSNRDDGRLGIPQLDELDLVNETISNKEVAAVYDWSGGAL